VVLKVVDYLSSAMGVDHVELNALGNWVPFEVEQRVEVAGLFPPLRAQLKAPLNHLGVVARTHDILKLLVVLLVLQ
jgi:hypothetical protein